MRGAARFFPPLANITVIYCPDLYRRQKSGLSNPYCCLRGKRWEKQYRGRGLRVFPACIVRRRLRRRFRCLPRINCRARHHHPRPGRASSINHSDLYRRPCRVYYVRNKRAAGNGLEYNCRRNLYVIGETRTREKF